MLSESNVFGSMAQRPGLIYTGRISRHETDNIQKRIRRRRRRRGSIVYGTAMGREIEETTCINCIGGIELVDPCPFFLQGVFVGSRKNT